MTNPIEAYPLCWPEGWPRTKYPSKSKFTTYFSRARDDLMREIKLLGGRNPILSTNIPLRKDGLPYAGHAQPKDCGAAVYFSYKSKSMCFACDRWSKIEDNIWSVCKTIEALRGIERWGASDMLDRAFTGFTALPAPEVQASKTWWDLLGFSQMPPTNHFFKQKAKELRNDLARKYHPDFGSEKNSDKMATINRAYEAAEKYFANC
jgi:hypothetical protein